MQKIKRAKKTNEPISHDVPDYIKGIERLLSPKYELSYGICVFKHQMIDTNRKPNRISRSQHIIRWPSSNLSDR